MTTSEGKRLSLIIFHVIAFTLLFISVPLILDQIFSRSIKGNNSPNYFELNFETVLAIISIVIASISWFILITKWIRKGRLEFYLKTIFFAKSVLIPGLILLLIA